MKAACGYDIYVSQEPDSFPSGYGFLTEDEFYKQYPSIGGGRYSRYLEHFFGEGWQKYVNLLECTVEDKCCKHPDSDTIWPEYCPRGKYSGTKKDLEDEWKTIVSGWVEEMKEMKEKCEELYQLKAVRAERSWMRARFGVEWSKVDCDDASAAVKNRGIDEHFIDISSPDSALKNMNAEVGVQRWKPNIFGDSLYEIVSTCDGEDNCKMFELKDFINLDGGELLAKSEKTFVPPSSKTKSV